MIGIALAVLAPLVGLLPLWGWAGHRVIGALSWELVAPDTRERLRVLLGDESLSHASTWADSIRPARRETAPLHYVNIPIWAPRYEEGRHCPERLCVITAIARYREVLASPAAAREERLEALRFLAHFVQDMHQPLHVGDRGDRGGNDVRITWQGRETNLHSVWDTELPRSLAPSETALLERLRARLARVPADTLASWRSGDVEAWAMEGQRIAREQVYRLPRDGVLDASYLAANREVVELQMIKAAVRLAWILDKED